MNWIVNKASIIGRDHELAKRNCQDFCEFKQTEDVIAGVVCDGCSEGKFSEVGATLLGKLILDRLAHCSKFEDSGLVGFYIQVEIKNFISSLMSFFCESEDEKVRFVVDHLLATLLFCYITNENVFIGNAGDGVIIKDDNVNIIDQNSQPYYPAYRSIKKEYLTVKDSSVGFITAEQITNLRRIVIGSDGIIPLINQNKVNELFGTKARQLQRKFNVWSDKDKMFYDDASCIVFERIEDESNIQK